MQCIGQQFLGWGGGVRVGNELRLGNDLLSTVKMGLVGDLESMGRRAGGEGDFCKLRIAGPIFRQLLCGTNLFIKIAPWFLLTVLRIGFHVMRCVISAIQ